MPPTTQAQAFAKELRQNMTDAEKLLWSKLRNRQLFCHKFRRQQPIGTFIADFYCSEAKLVIELDGHAHADQVEYDRERTNWLISEGYTVVRFWNGDVLRNINGVLQDIASVIDARIRELQMLHDNPAQ
jgi:very-short-patch-repair endonuclease